MAALRQAAQVFGRAMVRMCMTIYRSDESAAAVNVKEIDANECWVSPGYPTGEWGWEPIEAYMFETGAMHPLFGDRRHWYRQPYRPILNKTAVAGYPEAERVYANIRIPELAKEFGYK